MGRIAQFRRDHVCCRQVFRVDARLDGELLVSARERAVEDVPVGYALVGAVDVEPLAEPLVVGVRLKVKCAEGGGRAYCGQVGAADLVGEVGGGVAVEFPAP